MKFQKILVYATAVDNPNPRGNNQSDFRENCKEDQLHLPRRRFYCHPIMFANAIHYLSHTISLRRKSPHNHLPLRWRQMAACQEPRQDRRQALCCRSGACSTQDRCPGKGKRRIKQIGAVLEDLRGSPQRTYEGASSQPSEGYR